MVDYPDIDVSEADWIDEDSFHPRYNIAPRSNAPVIRRQSTEDSTLIVHTMKWGVVPHWSKHEDLTLNTINARAENLIETTGMWTSMKTKKRCVVVCDGYFEWLKKGRDRLPHFIRRKDRKLMILAGLYDSALLEGATAPLWTFTIVTTDAAPSFSWLHDRQPVILSSTTNFEAWLDTSKGWHAGLTEILKPGDGSELECFPVPKEVGKVGSNSASFIEPVSQRKDGIEAMFAKQAAKTKQAPSSSPPSNIILNETPAVAASPSDVKDGKTAKRAIEIDASPSPPVSQPLAKKQKIGLLPQRNTKRSIEEDDRATPAKKRLKGSYTSPMTKGGSPPLGTDNGTKAPGGDGSPPRDEVSLEAAASSQSKTKGFTRALSSPSKSSKSKGGVRESGSPKITAFFPSREPEARNVRGTPAT